MTLGSVSIDHSSWYNLALLATVAFSIFAVPLARRNRYSLLVCATPLLGNLLLAWFGLWHLTTFLSLVGAGTRAAAASIADAQAPIILGSLLTAAVSGALSVMPRHSALQIATRAELSVLAVGISLALGNLIFGLKIVRNHGLYSLSTVHWAQAGVLLALAILLISVVMQLVGFFRTTSGTNARWPFIVLAASAAGLGLVVWRFAHDMWRVAFGT